MNVSLWQFLTKMKTHRYLKYKDFQGKKCKYGKRTKLRTQGKAQDAHRASSLGDFISKREDSASGFHRDWRQHCAVFNVYNKSTED